MQETLKTVAPKSKRAAQMRACLTITRPLQSGFHVQPVAGMVLYDPVHLEPIQARVLVAIVLENADHGAVNGKGCGGQLAALDVAVGVDVVCPFVKADPVLTGVRVRCCAAAGAFLGEPVLGIISAFGYGSDADPELQGLGRGTDIDGACAGNVFDRDATGDDVEREREANRKTTAAEFRAGGAPAIANVVPGGDGVDGREAGPTEPGVEPVQYAIGSVHIVTESRRSVGRVYHDAEVEGEDVYPLSSLEYLHDWWLDLVQSCFHPGETGAEFVDCFAIVRIPRGWRSWVGGNCDGRAGSKYGADSIWTSQR
jgi:hypothetical protein